MLRWIIFACGLICGVVAAYLFLANEFTQGFAFLSMAAIFLLLSLLAFLRSSSEPVRKRPVQNQENNPEPGYDPATDIMARRELAAFVAQLAVMYLRDVGRTIPPSVKEIDQVEARVTNLLDLVGVHRTDRIQLMDDFDKLRGRIRRAEGGRALIRSTRL